jgi:pyruvate kinase
MPEPVRPDLPQSRRGAKAKIVATLGPASESTEAIAALIHAGADAFRLNFSHGSADWHKQTARTIRAVAGDTPVAILADLQGPRIRIGALREPVDLAAGAQVTLVAGPVEPGDDALPTTYDALAADVSPDDRMLVDNGLVELRVEETDGRRVRCRVAVGGTIRSNKGINLPGVAVSAPPLAEKDRRDAATAVELGADAIALSFVRRPEDVHGLRALLAEYGAKDLPIVSKIERGEAVEQFDAILAATDAVMVARGDLGVEMAQAKVPGIQKQIIAACGAAGKPVITATEMLQSMMTTPRPTRAEASDVANAILDGTDAVMLSGETAVGDYPVQSVATMNQITLEAESIRREWGSVRQPVACPVGAGDFACAVANAACTGAAQVGAVAIVVCTMSGSTARLVSQRRPRSDIIALTPHEATRRRLAMVWGIEPYVMPAVTDADALVPAANDLLRGRDRLRPGDVIVLVGGTGPLVGATNFVKVHVVR